MCTHGHAAPADLAQVAPRALADAAQRSGLNPDGARLIRLYATAVYHLPAADAVARIAKVTSSKTVASLATSVQACSATLAVSVLGLSAVIGGERVGFARVLVAGTRWLATIGFPAVEPLPVAQPVTSHGCAVTFWKYLPQDAPGPDPRPTDLGYLLHRLHQLAPPPITLPAYRPLRSTREAIKASQAVTDTERSWLIDHCGQLLVSYRQLTFQLPSGMIHGDAWRGNLLRGRGGVVLADWDQVSTGPRETDLIPTLQAVRFGLPEYERDAFIAAYGHDIHSWPGYAVLRDIRELSTLTALLRNAHTDPAAYRELKLRLRSLRTGDNQPWTTFLQTQAETAGQPEHPAAAPRRNHPGNQPACRMRMPAG